MKFRARLKALEARLGLKTGLPRPILITQLVGARRDAEGNLLEPNADFTEAETGGKAFHRGEDESRRDFEARVVADVPPCGFAGEATFWCKYEEPPKPTM
jgi:hypothetical protein